ncbi:MAG: ATP-binding protein, partial [Polyangiales bacterium]
RQILPYRSQSRQVEGVVVTFVDVSDLKWATERLEVREQQQAVVARLGLHALRELRLDAFFDRLVRAVQQTLDTDYCEILELQPGGDKLLLRAGVGWRKGLVGSAFVGAGSDSQAGYTLQATEPVIVDDLSAEERFDGPPLLTEHRVSSGLSCVIGDGQLTYGVLGAHTRGRRTFSREDANFLQAVASVAASAVARHQARLRLAVELGVRDVLASSRDPHEGLDRCLSRIASELDAPVAELWWPEPDGRRLVRRSLHTASRDLDRGVRARLGGGPVEVGEGLVGRVAERGEATWCTERSEPSSFARTEGAAAPDLVSAVAFPVHSGQERPGVVTVLSDARMFATHDLLRSLEGLGHTLGDFIQRSEAETRMRRLAAITESAQDAILSYDLEGTIVEWLPGAERLFGYAAAEMLGRSIEHIVPPDRRDELWAINARIVDGEVVPPYEAVRLRKDGTPIEVSIRSSPVKDREGNVTGISSSDRDITRQKEDERQLVEANRQKDEFLAMLGHELRNPLAAIRSVSELLKLTSGGNPQLERSQGVLERQTNQMAKLLDGLLDVSRIVRGKIELELEGVDMAAVCREAVEDLGHRIPQRELELVTDVPPEPVWVEGDRVRLTQIVDNLLSNAVKFTPDGGRVTLSLATEGQTATLAVRDTGSGIEPELLPHVFEVFRQSKQTFDRSHGGLGLGLALVKGLAELHGGDIRVHSDGRDQGTEILIRLPLAGAVASREPDPPARPDRALRILLVEDNEDAAATLRQVLEVGGHEVLVTEDGPGALAMVDERAPDAILCDLGLPGAMSGYDLAAELRARPGAKQLPLVAVSGYGRPEDRKRSSEAGFDAHVTKPVDVGHLQRTLARLCARSVGFSQQD